MGKVDKVYHEELIPSEPDRQCNYLKVYEAPNEEVTIRFRNMKIVLHTPDEIAEWKEGFTEALKKYKELQPFKNDI